MDAKQARKHLQAGRAIYAEYWQGEQVKRRVFAFTNHGDEVTLEHGPADRVRLAWNRVVLTRG